VVLIDFGVSKHYDREGHQTTSTPVGLSKGYAPFEQYREGGVREFSPATDVYSLGATLYHLVTGHTPPEAAVLVDSPLVRTNEVSGPLWQIISRAMSFRRQDRYQSMTDLINALRKVPVEVKPITPEPVMPKPVTPKPEPKKPEPKTQDSVETKLSSPTPPSQKTKPAGSSETKTVITKKKSKMPWIVSGVGLGIVVLAIITAIVNYTGRHVGPLTLKGHTLYVMSAAFSPDGRRIVSASCDSTIRIWDAQTGRQIGKPLEGHTDYVWSVAFSPDGQRIVSASWDLTIKIRDVSDI